MLIGHVAVSQLEHHYLDLEPLPVLGAAIFPDLLDKLLCQGLHLTTSGRMWGHTLLGWGLTTAIIGLIWGRYAMVSWAVGYVSHLLCDLGGLVPWLYPFVRYDFPPSPGLWEILRNFLTDPAQIGLEGVLALWAVGTRVRLWIKQHHRLTVGG